MAEERRFTGYCTFQSDGKVTRIDMSLTARPRQDDAWDISLTLEGSRRVSTIGFLFIPSKNATDIQSAWTEELLRLVAIAATRNLKLHRTVTIEAFTMQ